MIPSTAHVQRECLTYSYASLIYAGGLNLFDGGGNIGYRHRTVATRLSYTRDAIYQGSNLIDIILWISYGALHYGSSFLYCGLSTVQGGYGLKTKHWFSATY